MKIHKDFPDYFREIQVRFSRFYASVLNKADMSISQYALLNQILSSGPIPMSEVGEKLHITKPAVTHLVDRLEHRKFLKRISHPTDRRVSLLKILPKGEHIVQRIQENVFRVVTEALRTFDSKERDVIVRYQRFISEIIDDVLNQSETV